MNRAIGEAVFEGSPILYNNVSFIIQISEANENRFPSLDTYVEV